MPSNNVNFSGPIDVHCHDFSSCSRGGNVNNICLQFFTSETKKKLIDQYVTGASMSYFELHHTRITKMLIRISELLAVNVQLYQGSDNALCMHAL